MNQTTEQRRELSVCTPARHYTGPPCPQSARHYTSAPTRRPPFPQDLVLVRVRLRTPHSDPQRREDCLFDPDLSGAPLFGRLDVRLVDTFPRSTLSSRPGSFGAARPAGRGPPPDPCDETCSPHFRETLAYYVCEARTQGVLYQSRGDVRVRRTKGDVGRDTLCTLCVPTEFV